jgi:hypothetical protein
LSIVICHSEGQFIIYLDIKKEWWVKSVDKILSGFSRVLGTGKTRQDWNEHDEIY